MDEDKNLPQVCEVVDAEVVQDPGQNCRAEQNFSGRVKFVRLSPLTGIIAAVAIILLGLVIFTGLGILLLPIIIAVPIARIFFRRKL
ncbi:MAG: hypothetical protein NTW04_03890 [Elusimicrobia bacterium]|nr:hypothetical protein [Elusimicrobiota bacterium]